MDYSHTKSQQWQKFSDIVAHYIKKNKLFIQDCDIFDIDNIQSKLNYYIEDISSGKFNSENIMLIALWSNRLYNIILNDYYSWIAFSFIVERHIVEYAEKQYGNFPDKTIAKFNPIKIQGKMEAYVDRIGKSARGEKDAMRDALKIAHFACYLYFLINHGDAQYLGR